MAFMFTCRGSAVTVRVSVSSHGIKLLFESDRIHGKVGMYSDVFKLMSGSAGKGIEINRVLFQLNEISESFAQLCIKYTPAHFNKHTH